MVESTYLYSKNNIDLYHRMLDEFNSSECVFSRNLLVFLENGEREPGPFYSKHINECSICQKKAREYSALLMSVNRAIPVASLPENFQSLVKREIKESLKLAFQRLEEKDSTSLWSKKFLFQVFEDLGKRTFLTRDFLKGIALASLSAAILYFVL